MKRTKSAPLALLLALCLTLGLLPALTPTASAAVLTLCGVALAALYAVTRTARYPAKRTGLAVLVLALCLTPGLLPALDTTAWALDNVAYQEASWNSTTNKVVYTAKTTTATEVTASDTGWSSGWYVVTRDSDITNSNRITVSGTVNLILCDGAKLTATNGINLKSGNTLNIYAQSSGDRMGAIAVPDGGQTNGWNQRNAGIGGNTEESGGTLTIHGGTVTVTGGSNAAGIGGGYKGNGGDLTVYGGIITATSGQSSAGIGGGNPYSGGTYVNGNGGTVKIYGGTVKANGHYYGLLGIGRGKGGSSDGTLVIGEGMYLYGSEESTNPENDLSNYVSQVENNYARYQYITVNNVAPHIHSFTYSTNGATITATCSADGCNLTDGKASLTIRAPETEAGGAAVLDGDADAFGVSASDIKYYQKSGADWTEMDGTPSGSGFFKGSLTIASAYTIEAAYGVNAITIASGIENGTITAPPVATVGAVVPLTNTPATGYELDTLTVTKTAGGGSVDTVAVDGGGKSFVMPDEEVTVSATFKLVDYAITLPEDDTVTAAVEGQNTTTAHYNDTVTLTVTPAEGYSVSAVTVNGNATTKVNDITYTFTMPASSVTVSPAFAAIGYAVTVGIIDNGTATASKTSDAHIGDEITLTATPDAGYQFDSWTVTKAGGGTVTVTNSKFAMPADNVTVTATFAKRDVAVTLTVSAGETPCASEFLTKDFAAVSENFTRQVDEKFVLSVSVDEDYDYTIKFNDSADTANQSMKAFSNEEYKTYAEYLKTNNITVPAQTELFWVTMPAVAESNLDIAVSFVKVKSFTVLYQPATTAESAETVWCKFTNSENQNYAAEMTRDLNMSGVTVWSVSLKSAFEPNQIAFVTVSKTADTTALKTALDGASLISCSVQTNADNWNSITDGQYIVIGGDAKAVVAGFVNEDASTSDRDALTVDSIGASAKYEIAVCLTNEEGIITAAGTVTAPAAPTKEGFTFGGWGGFQYDAGGKASEKIYAAGDSVPVRANITLSAVWTPIVPKINLDANGGEGGSNVTQVNYGEKLTIAENPTRKSFAFVDWIVAKSVIENSKFFPWGASFDFNIAITENLNLIAQWKHVHTYSCVPLNYSGFGDALEKYYGYLPYIHVRFCGCADVELETHTFHNGVCTGCGYTKPGATEVTLEVSYWKDGATNAWINELPRTVKKNEEVTVEAFYLIDNYQFSKWQYSADSGATWKDFAADTMVGFIIPCSLRVRAIYVSAITQPQIEMNARSYETEAQGYTWDSVLFQMNYKLPDSYTFIDAGVRMGDNAGISYYEMKEAKQSTGQKAALVGLEIGVNLIPFVGGGLAGPLSNLVMDAMSDDGPQYYYEKRENSVLDEMTAATLSEYMMEVKPVNVEKYPPIYWETKAATRSQCGSVNTLTPLSFIQKNNGKHYIYGMAYLTYKTPNGETGTIYTEALPVTRDNVPGYTVKATPNGMTNTKQG